MNRGVARGAGSVRIIGGTWRGTMLPVAASAGLRPTPDRVRETLFNWLQPALPGARVLDLFAGSGALGLEAVSRGAREAFLVERDAALARSLDETVARLDAGASATVVRADAMAWLRVPLHGRFDVVFVDPPFDAGAWPGVVDALPPWLAEGAWLYLEMPAGTTFEPGGRWSLHRQGSTRETRHALYRVGAGPAATLQPDPRADGMKTSA